MSRTCSKCFWFVSRPDKCKSGVCFNQYLKETKSYKAVLGYAPECSDFKGREGRARMKMDVKF